MTNDFYFFSFSVFDYSDITSFAETVKAIFRHDINNGRAKLNAGSCLVKDYFNPPCGGNHDDIFSFWKIKSDPNHIFFSSNSEDGRLTLCNVLHMKLKCNFVMCSLSNDIKNPLYHFHFSKLSMEERDVLAYKDPKWVFYTNGVPLAIEDLSLYEKRRIKDRLNNEVIKTYLLRLGINFDVIDNNITHSYTFTRDITEDKCNSTL